MKTETLISQILPTQKSDKKPAHEELRKQNTSSSSAPKVAFADLLRPQSSAVAEKKMPAAAPTKRSEPAERATASKSPERDEAPSRTEAPERDSRQADEAALKRFEERKRLKNAEARTSQAETGPSNSQPEAKVVSSDKTEATGTDTQPTLTKKSKLDRETIGAIKKILGDEKQMAEAIPAIAILTGHLEHVEPKSIPVVVSSNQFLQEAFSAKDVTGFMSQPVSIGQILSKIGINDEQINQLAQSGVDVSTFMSPADLLGNLGFDVQSLGSEIQILKDNITVNNGLSGYIARAEKLQSKAPNTSIKTEPTQNIEREFTEVKPNPDQNQKELLAQAAQIKNSPVTQSPSAGSPTSQRKRSSSDEESVMAMVAPKSETPAAVGEQLTSVTFGAVSAEQASSKIKNSNLSSETANSSGATVIDFNLQMAAQNSVPASDSTSVPAKEKLTVDELAEWMRAQGEQGPNEFSIEKTEGPVFGQFAQNVKMQKVTLPAETQPTPDLKPAELDMQDPALLTQLASHEDIQPPKINTEKLKPTSHLEMVVQTEQDSDQPLATQEYRSNLNQDYKGTQTGKTPDNSLAHNLIAANIHKNPIAKESIRLNNLERMALAPVTTEVAPSGEKANSGQSSFSQDQQQSGAKSNIDSLTGLGQLKQTGQANQSDTSFEKMLTLDAPNQVTGKVIDRARMMVKEGGGEVIIDLGSEELGKIELAMNVHNNKVELKILAASDQVRELLSNDLATLRESLAIQDLKLSEVEVGIGQREFADQNQNSGRNSNSSQFERQQNGNAQRFAQNSNFSRPVSMIRRPLPRAASHSGRIQVQA